MSVEYTQRVFNQTLEELLSNCDSKTWPRTVNKKGLIVSLGALKYTERADKSKIERELLREINVKGGVIPIGLAIASKRASKGWAGQGNLSGYSKKEKAKAIKKLSLQNWRKQVEKKFNSMLKGRGVSSAFIKSGWWTVAQVLGPIVGGKWDRSGGRGVPIRGAKKGTVSPAIPGRLQVVMQNTAAARSDHRGGFIRIGEPPLQKAMADEARKTQEYLDDMKGDIDRFNRKQH